MAYSSQFTLTILIWDLWCWFQSWFSFMKEISEICAIPNVFICNLRGCHECLPTQDLQWSYKNFGWLNPTKPTSLNNLESLGSTMIFFIYCKKIQATMSFPMFLPSAYITTMNACHAMCRICPSHLGTIQMKCKDILDTYKWISIPCNDWYRVTIKRLMNTHTPCSILRSSHVTWQLMPFSMHQEFAWKPHID